MLVSSLAPPEVIPRLVARRGRSLRWLAGVALSVAVLLASIAFIQRQGIDAGSWLSSIWLLIVAVPLPFLILALVLKASEVALNAVAWAVVLRAALPGEKIAFRQTLGVVQGGVGIFAVIPPKFGGLAVLALYRAIFPTIALPTILATRVVQGLSSTLLGAALLVAFGVMTAGIGTGGGQLETIVAFASGQPIIAAIAAAIVVGLLVALLHRGRDWLRAILAQLTLAGAILRSPRRYLVLVVAPTLLAFALRWGVTGTLLAAFGIPVTWETLLRVNVSHGLARSVQVTPGGLGTTQAFDLVALQGVASTEAIVAYSLSQTAILLLFNLAFGFAALLWALGWDRTARLLRLPGRPSEHSAPVAPGATAG
jgi:hypothetical protein